MNENDSYFWCNFDVKQEAYKAMPFCHRLLIIIIKEWANEKKLSKTSK